MKIHLFLAWIQKRTKKIIWQSRKYLEVKFLKSFNWFWTTWWKIIGLVTCMKAKKWRHIYSLLRLHENSRPPQTTKPKFFCDNIKLFCSNMGQFKLTNLIQVDPWKSCCFLLFMKFPNRFSIHFKLFLKKKGSFSIDYEKLTKNNCTILSCCHTFI